MRRTRWTRTVTLLLTIAACCFLAPAASAAVSGPGYTGSGYWIYSCRAAAAAGYPASKAPFVQQMQWYTYDGSGTVIQAPGSPLPVGNQWNTYDTCASGGEFGGNHKPFTGRVNLPIPGGSGGTGPLWEIGFNWFGGLAFQHLEIDDNITSYNSRLGQAVPATGWWMWSLGGTHDPWFRGCNGSHDYTNGPVPNPTRIPIPNTGTAANPQGFCHLSGPSVWNWSPALGMNLLQMHVQCGNINNGSSFCRSGDPADPEAEGTNGQAYQAFLGGVMWMGQVRSVRALVHDFEDPALTLLWTSTMGTGGDGTDALETLAFTTSDNAGIRRIEFRIDGRLLGVRDYNANCKPIYAAPCPEATGPSAMHLRAPGVIDQSPFRFDVDPLLIGNHTATITVTDGSGRQTTRSLPFTVDTPMRWYYDCAGNISLVPLPTSSIPCGSPGGPGGGLPPGDVDTDDPSAIPVPPPISGTGIFSYDLAYNPDAASSSPNVGDCEVREAVVRGSGGGAFNDREKNQIITVHINLRGYVSDAKGLGQQDLRSSFELPTRTSSRYRGALGCPS